MKRRTILIYLRVSNPLQPFSPCSILVSPRIPKYQFTLPPPGLKLSTTLSNHPIVSPNPWPKSNFSRFSPRRVSNPRLKTHRNCLVLDLCNSGMPHLNTSLYRVVIDMWSAYIEISIKHSRLNFSSERINVLISPLSPRNATWMASPYLHLQVPLPAEPDREQP